MSERIEEGLPRLPMLTFCDVQIEDDDGGPGTVEAADYVFHGLDPKAELIAREFFLGEPRVLDLARSIGCSETELYLCLHAIRGRIRERFEQLGEIKRRKSPDTIANLLVDLMAESELGRQCKRSLEGAA